MPRLDMLTLDKVPKYSATRGSFTESESSIEKKKPPGKKS